MPVKFPARFAYFLLRLVAGLIIFQAGAVTLFGWFGGLPPNTPPVEVFSQGWIGAVLQVVCGVMVMIGFFARPAAFILSGEMAVAYWQFHYKWSEHLGWTWPAQNGGIPAVLLCFIFLLFAAHGSGMLSVDEGRALRKANAPKPAK